MPDWSIKIVASDSGIGAAFQPDLQGYKAGDALSVEQYDLVTWNNTTEDMHQPWPTDSDYNPLPESQVLPRGSANYMSDPIPGGESSRPSYSIAQPTTTPNNWTIYYYCKQHPDVESERGTMEANVLITT